MSTPHKSPVKHKTPVMHIFAKDGTSSEAKLDATLFEGEVHQQLLAQYVRVYLANTRQGTASTKDRSQIIGTTKKMYKQKGTGNARHASAKAPIFVGGGVAGGPKPRDFSIQMNKKQRLIALKSALRHVAQAGGSIVQLAEDASAVAKTKDIMNIFAKAKLATRRMLLIVDPKVDASIQKATRNVRGISLTSIDEVNAYDIAKCSSIVFTSNTYSQFVSRFAK